MKKNKKRNRIMLLLILLLGISIGFAALATTLKINGNASITKNTWDIYWDNIANKSGVTPTTEPVISADENNVPKTLVTWGVTLDKPGDYYEFTVDAVNNGSLDAMITSIESKINNSSIISTNNGSLVVADPSPVPSFIKYSVKYADGEEIELNHLLAKKTNDTPTRETYKIRVEYDRDAVTNSDVNNQQSDTTYTFSFAVTYGQADDNAVAVRKKYKAGDPIEIDGEEFYFLEQNEDDKVLLLTKYALINEGDDNNPQWVQNTNTNVENYISDFSSSVYWHEEEWLEQSSRDRTGGTLDNYYDDYYMANFNRGGTVLQAESSYVYRTKNNQDTDNYIYPIINNYKSNLKSKFSIDNIDARLISVYEAIRTGCKDFAYGSYKCKDWIASAEYWMGSTDDYECDNCIYSFYDTGDYYIIGSSVGSLAIRPVVEMSLTDFKNKVEAQNN